jgi:hypothetical protein
MHGLAGSKLRSMTAADDRDGLALAPPTALALALVPRARSSGFAPSPTDVVSGARNSPRWLVIVAAARLSGGWRGRST